jgi:hypothetical protein
MTVFIWGRKRTLAGNTVYHNGLIDTSLDPPLYHLKRYNMTVPFTVIRLYVNSIFFVVYTVETVAIYFVVQGRMICITI